MALDLTPLVVFLMSTTAAINAWELKQIYNIRRELDSVQRGVDENH